jgi:hypothetical protein
MTSFKEENSILTNIKSEIGEEKPPPTIAVRQKRPYRLLKRKNFVL